MKVKSESEVAQLCPTLSDPMDCSLPGASVHGIFQARVLEWGATAFSDGQNYVPPNSYGEVLTSRRRNMTVLRNSIFKEVIKLKRGH